MSNQSGTIVITKCPHGVDQTQSVCMMCANNRALAEITLVNAHEQAVMQRLDKIVRLLTSIEYHVRTGR